MHLLFICTTLTSLGPFPYYCPGTACAGLFSVKIAGTNTGISTVVSRFRVWSFMQESECFFLRHRVCSGALQREKSRPSLFFSPQIVARDWCIMDFLYLTNYFSNQVFQLNIYIAM